MGYNGNLIKEQMIQEKNVFLHPHFLFHLARLILMSNLSWYQILAWPLIMCLRQIADSLKSSFQLEMTEIKVQIFTGTKCNVPQALGKVFGIISVL